MVVNGLERRPNCPLQCSCSQKTCPDAWQRPTTKFPHCLTTVRRGERPALRQKASSSSFRAIGAELYKLLWPTMFSPLAPWIHPPRYLTMRPSSCSCPYLFYFGISAQIAKLLNLRALKPEVCFQIQNLSGPYHILFDEDMSEHVNLEKHRPEKQEI